MICQVPLETIDYLSEIHSLRKPPHAFDSELVKKSHVFCLRRSETDSRKGLLKKTGMLLSIITVSWVTKQEILLIFHVLR